MTLRDIEKMKAEKRMFNKTEEQAKKHNEETGQNALRLSSKFHEKLLFVKKHLEYEQHPIGRIVNHFRNVYSCQYYFLLMKNKKVFLRTFNKDEGKNEQDADMIYQTESLTKRRAIENNVNVLKQEIKGFISCIVSVLLKFYFIQLPRQDIKRDLFENIITNIILKDEIYVILFSLYSELLEEDI